MNTQAKIDYADNDKKKGQAQKIDSIIGQRLKELRRIRNLTQEDVAQKLGVSFQQIQKYESGKNRISFGRLYELSTFLKVSLDSFVSTSDAGQNYGLSDNAQSPLSPSESVKEVSQKETEELLKIYYSLEEPALRKNLLKFMKTMAETLKS